MRRLLLANIDYINAGFVLTCSPDRQYNSGTPHWDLLAGADRFELPLSESKSDVLTNYTRPLYIRSLCNSHQDRLTRITAEPRLWIEDGGPRDFHPAQVMHMLRRSLLYCVRSPIFSTHFTYGPEACNGPVPTATSAVACHVRIVHTVAHHRLHNLGITTQLVLRMVFTVQTHQLPGSPSRTWTYDLAVNSRALYLLSYRGILVHVVGLEPTSDGVEIRCLSVRLYVHNGALDGVRSHNLMLGKHLFYQLNY